MALVSVNDLKVYMDISLTNRQVDACEMILAGLQSELEAFLRRPIEPQTFIEEHRLDSQHHGVPMTSFLSVSDYNYTDTFVDNVVDSTTFASPPPAIYLKNTPIVSITQVKVKPVFGTERILQHEQHYIERTYGIDYYYGYPDDLVTITYTAGLDGASIPVFKLMILRAATREMQNMHDDVVGVKDLNPRGVAPIETGFLDAELSTLRKYKRTRI
jgi:hypothetical protein